MPGTKPTSVATGAVALVALLATAAGCSSSAGTPALPTDAGSPVDEQDAIADGGVSPDVTPPSLPDGSADAGASSICARLCATIVARGCPSDDLGSCIASCENLFADAKCGPAYSHFAACQADRPVTDFACSSDKAVLANGICVTEGQAFADCLLF